MRNKSAPRPHVSYYTIPDSVLRLCSACGLSNSRRPGVHVLVHIGVSSSVSIKTRMRGAQPRDRGSILATGGFSVLLIVHTGCGIHPSCFSVGSVGSFFPLEKKGHGIPPLRMSSATPPFLRMLSCRALGPYCPYFVRPSVLCKGSSDFRIGVTERITKLHCYLLATAAVGQVLANLSREGRIANLAFKKHRVLI
jgi:hypothetical protein